MSTEWRLVFLLSLANASMSFTIAEMKVFSAFREWIKARNNWLGDLFFCGYCLGHWSALLLTAIYQPRLFHAWWALDFFLTALVIAWLSAFQWIVLCWLIQRVGK
jgi:hypothetical protein